MKLFIRGTTYTIASFLLIFTIFACETPKDPSFEVEQTYSLPLISEISYIFLGENDAIIDTTSADFEDLFNVEPNGLVTLGVEVDFDIGNFDNALPDPEVEEFEIDAIIEDLRPELSGSGETDFESVTGLDPELFPEGSPIFGSTATGIQISIDLDEFVQAQIESGAIEFTFVNNMGFDIQMMEFYFESDGNQISESTIINDFDHGDVSVNQVEFNDGDILSVPLSVVVDVTWQDQDMKSEPGSLVVADIENSGLTFINAQAIFESQTINDTYIVEISADEFTFEDDNDFVELEEANVIFQNIQNTIDLDIDQLVISFPTIITESAPGVYNPADSLVIIREGNNRIRRGSHPNNINGINFEIPLNNVRIFAPDNIITVNVKGTTEDTSNAPPGDRVRTITAEEGVTGTVLFEIVETAGASGILEPRVFNLNDADDNNLDLFDPNVRIESDVSDLESLSERISNLQLTNPALTLDYTSNVAVGSRIYAAIVGISEDGNEVMLRGSAGTPFFVAPNDTVSGLLSRGAPISNADLIAINVEAADLQGSTQSITFDIDNSNIAEFLSNLPVEIYFVGKALVNPDRNRGEVITPIDIDSGLNVHIPFSLRTVDGDPVAFSDTLDASLSDLPEDGDDTFISEALLTISYTNLIPLDINVDLDFLDEESNVITRLPQAGDATIRMSAATIDNSGFSTEPENGVIQISLTEEQLRQLHRTEQIKLSGELLTRENESVSIRSNDTLILGVNGTFKIRLKVD